MKRTKEILGGYNPLTWKAVRIDRSSYKYYKTNDSFIFSFKKDNNTGSDGYILSRVMDANRAIKNNFRCGPSFGGGDLTTVYGALIVIVIVEKFHMKNRLEKLQVNF